MKKPIARLAVLALFALAPVASAQSIGDIVETEFLPGWRTPQGTHMGAVRVQLAPGWKTYWRSPGDAGVPPVFDWSGSRNVARIEVHWPRPDVFDFSGMRTIGYQRDVVLPVEIWPIDAAAPVDVQGQLDFGVCKEVCVPTSASLGAKMAGAGLSDPMIAAALNSRPEPARKAGLRGHDCAVDAAASGLSLHARIDMPKLGPDEVVVVETADPRIWVSEAAVTRTGNTLTAQVDLVSPTRQPFGLDRSGLRLTVLAGGRAVEISGCPAP